MKAILAILSLSFTLASLTGSALSQEVILRPGETFMLRISGVPADESAMVSGRYSIANDGTIRLQYINPVNANDLTPSQLSRKIELAYTSAEIYTKPTVNIDTTESKVRDQYVTIMGEVNATRPIPHNPNLRLLSAIAQAGGFTDYAARDRVVLVRDGKRTEHDLRKAGSQDDVLLRPGDQVVVAESKPFDIFKKKGKKN